MAWHRIGVRLSGSAAAEALHARAVRRATDALGAEKYAALIAEELSNQKIADQLTISKRTVDAHVEHIFGN